MARPTSNDVADRAGVSQSTVSLVLSGKDAGRVAPATAQGVRDAARALGYRPHAAARSLRTGTTGAVGLLVPDVRNPFFGSMLRGAQRTAWAEGVSVALVDFDDDPTQAAAAHETLAAGVVDGIVHFGWRGPAPDLAGVPTVLIEAERRGVDSVRLDVEDGIRQAYAHLLGLGHVRIGHLRSEVDEQTFTRRLDAARAVLAKAGLDHAALPQGKAPFTVQGARTAARALVDLPPDERPTAVVCDDDILAAGLVLAARDAGLDVPGDLSVVGFDDLDVARALDVTTIAIDAEELGAVAYRLLRDRIAKPTGRRRREVLPVALLVRGTTAPPRS